MGHISGILDYNSQNHATNMAIDHSTSRILGTAIPPQNKHFQSLLSLQRGAILFVFVFYTYRNLGNSPEHNDTFLLLLSETILDTVLVAIIL